jgi:hypothetical protein
MIRSTNTHIENSAISLGDHGYASVVIGPHESERPEGRRNGVFICYRREDTAHAAGRLGEFLSQRNPQLDVFVDVHSVRPATDFLRTISSHLSSSFLALALIGRNWLQLRDGKSRLEDPEDYVRGELELARRGGVVILPILVDGASMPDPRHVPDTVVPVLRLDAVSLRYEEFPADAAGISEIVRHEYRSQR